ncbi:phytoene desaturase family protein [Proteinivorax hydrogeniformans]|uniref:Phytoene desaturase family protein n=1 Tax=Proteinivorax hydrogeniformans TaxID=1826727 RepID=A0AAU8HUM6_9FIRM
MKIGIIGGGPGGLAVGMLLASKGLDVTIYEREQSVGGRCGKLTDEDEKYIFDIGPTFLMMPYILEDIFSKCNKNLHDYVNLNLLEPYYRLNYRDGSTFHPGQNYQRVKREISKLSPGDIDGFENYMKDNKKKFEKTFPVLQGDYQKFYDIFNLDILKFLGVLRPWSTLWDDLGKHFKDDRIKVGFTFQSKYLGMSPMNCPSVFSILSFVEYSSGIYHVQGGLHQLSEGMEKAFKEMGGKLELGCDVKKIIIEGKKAKGIELSDGTKQQLDEVVMNADFAWGMQNLIDDEKRKKYKDEKLRQKKYSCSTFMMYLGLNKKYEHLPHHSIYISEDYKRNFDDIESGNFSYDPSFYIQNPCVTDDNLAPKDHSALYVLVPVPNLKNEINWDKKTTEEFKKKILRLMKERAGLDGIEEHIEFEDVVTPKNWEKRFRVGYGATFNLAHNIRQLTIFRPRNRFEEFDNMWLVGGGTNPGSGLPTIYESGRITAYGIFKKYNIEMPAVITPPVTSGIQV